MSIYFTLGAFRNQIGYVSLKKAIFWQSAIKLIAPMTLKFTYEKTWIGLNAHPHCEGSTGTFRGHLSMFEPSH